MEEIFKTLLSIILILLLAFTGVGLITVSVSVANAKSFQEEIVTEIEDSNFSDTVMSACSTEAANQGYELEFKNKVLDDYGNMTSCEVILKYKYNIPVFGMNNKEHTLRAFAR